MENYKNILTKKKITEVFQQVLDDAPKERTITAYRGCITHGYIKFDSCIHCGNKECASCNQWSQSLKDAVKDWRIKL